MKQLDLFTHDVTWDGRRWQQVVRPYGLARLIARLRIELLEDKPANRAQIQQQLNAAYKLQARM